MLFNLKVGVLIFFGFCTFGVPQVSGQNRLDSLLITWKRVKSDQNFSQDTNTINLLNNISRSYLYNNLDSAQFFANSAYTLARNQKMDSGQAWALNNLGSAYYISGTYDKALEAYLKSLKIFRKIGNHNRVLWAYNNLGLIYIAQGKYDEAIEEYNRIIQSKIAKRDSLLLATGYFNLGLTFDHKNASEQATTYLQKSIEISRKSDFDRMEVMAINRLGEIYLHAHDYEEAEKYYRKALDASYEDNWENSFAHAGLARVNYELGLYDNAVRHGLKGLEYAEKLKTKWDAQRVLRTLAEAYAAKNDYESAYKYHVLYKQYGDSLISETKEKRMADLHLQQKEEENLQLQKENEINKQKAKINKLLSLFVGFLALFMVILVSVIYRNGRLKTALNEELQKKNSDIALQKQQISDQNEILEGLNTTKDKLLSIIGHDLRSPMASILGTLEVIRMGVLTTDQQEEVFKGLHNKVITVSHMLDNLLSWVSSQQMGMSAEFERVDIPATVNQVLAVANFLAQEKNIVIEHETAEVFAYADINHVRIIIQNIIGNAIKFTHRGGKVQVFYSDDGDYIGIHIKDSGLGIEEQKLDKLFNQVGKGISAMGTDKELGTGMGLMLVGQFIRENHGQVEIKSEEGKGTEFKIYFKKYTEGVARNI